jgi:hypothetical protein
LAIRYQCGMFTVLHENPGSEIGKTRGHLGSQLERKQFAGLRLAKDKDEITTVWTDRSRKASIPKSQGIRFAYDKEAGLHLPVAIRPMTHGPRPRGRTGRVRRGRFPQCPQSRACVGRADQPHKGQGRAEDRRGAEAAGKDVRAGNYPAEPLAKLGANRRMKTRQRSHVTGTLPQRSKDVNATTLLPLYIGQGDGGTLKGADYAPPRRP